MKIKINYYCLNPYFIGLPILIPNNGSAPVTYSTVSILILLDYLFLLDGEEVDSISQYDVSILILLDYLFL